MIEIGGNGCRGSRESTDYYMALGCSVLLFLMLVAGYYFYQQCIVCSKDVKVLQSEKMELPSGKMELRPDSVRGCCSSPSRSVSS